MKRTFRIILALTILLLLYCGTAQARETVLVTSTERTWNDNDYVVEGDVTISSGPVFLYKDVTLTLTEGSTLTIPRGILMRESGNTQPSLTIYGSGTLISGSQSSDSAGIEVRGGVLRIAMTGSITCYSHNTHTTGIGGVGSTIYIESGTVNAHGFRNGAGIGGEASRVTISGGTVNAYGGQYSAGIGGNSGCSGNYVTITGGVVNAYGGAGRDFDGSTYGGGAGIGGGGTDGNHAAGGGGVISISGGQVTAVGGSYAAGIGGGSGSPSYTGGHGGSISITGGQVTSTSEYGYGIGAGQGKQRGDKGAINLGWTDYTDSIFADEYYGNVTFLTGTDADRKQFWLENTTTIANINNMFGVRLIPARFMTIHIQNEEDWNAACGVLHDQCRTTMYLDKDVVLSTSACMMGTETPFTGVFHGQGHTLTVNINDTGTCSAPFSHIVGANIDNRLVN